MPATLWSSACERNLSELRGRTSLLGLTLVFVTLGSPLQAQTVDLIQLPTTQHSHTGGGENPENAYDGDFETSHQHSIYGTDGGYGITITNEHGFACPESIDTVIFGIKVYSYCFGQYILEREGSYGIEYKAGGDWITIPASYYGYYVSGETGESTLDSGVVELTDLNLTAVTHIRAVAHAFGNASGGEGWAGGAVWIYEIQAFGTTQACCFIDGSCEDLTRGQCICLCGTPQGPQTTCQTTECEAEPDDRIQLPSTIHTDTGGGESPENAYDGDFETSHQHSTYGFDGGYGVTITNEHEFVRPEGIDTIIFRMKVHSYCFGQYILERSGDYAVEYRAGGDWNTVPGSYDSYYVHDQTGESTLDSGIVELTGLDLTGVTHIRAKAHAFGNASGEEGWAGADVWIHEIQAYSYRQACCFSDGSCANLRWGDCVCHCGAPMGAGTDCDSATCDLAIYVDDDASLGGDGATWETAFKYLQDALVTASPAYQIRVAQGTYTPDQGEFGNVTPGDREATFQLPDCVGLYGGYRGCPDGDCLSGDPNERDIELYETILSGDLAADDVPGDPNFAGNDENSYHVVTASGTTKATILDGPTITAGNADAAGRHHDGAGMYSRAGSPTLADCTFRENRAQRGGGMFNVNFSSPQLTNCGFTGNVAEGNESLGGGMYNGYGSDPTLISCIFTGNSAGNWGGGISNRDNAPTLIDCTFSDNSCDGCGGGMFSGYLGGVFHGYISAPTLDNCTFTGNSAEYGGGICNHDNLPTITNCVFSGNSAEVGAGIWNDDAAPTIHGCLFLANTAAMAGALGNWINQGLIHDADLTVTDCDFVGNVATNGGGAVHSDFIPGTTFTNCTFSGNSTAGNGGAIWCLTEPTVMTDCTFTDNSALAGGGAVIHLHNQPTMTNCLFSNNTASFAGALGNWDIGSLGQFVNCTFSGNSATWMGGGMENYGYSSPLIIDCVFVGNVVTEGFGSGGIDNALNSNPMIIDCTFEQNAAVLGGGIGNWEGSSPLLRGCEFTANSAEYGGGIYNDVETVPTLTECTFSENAATDWGGAMFNDYQSQPMLANCILNGNLAEQGGAVYNDALSSPTLVNCVLSGNSAAWNGAGIYNDADATPVLSNCTISSNVAGYGGGGLYNYASSSPGLANCILWANRDWGGIWEYAQIQGGTPVVSYSCVQDDDPNDEYMYPGIGNIDDDPLFFDVDGPDDDPNTWEDNDYRLSSGSPCIDAADNTAVPSDAADLDEDDDTDERTPLDLDGLRRFVDHPGTEDTGLADPNDPTLPIVDMGAYEFGIFGDLDGNCEVSLSDLAELLGSYGETSGMTYEDGDLDEDGGVDLADLSALLAVYGTICP